MAEDTHREQRPTSGDESLWSRFIEGDEGALLTLASRYRDELYWYLLLSTGRPRTAAEGTLSVWSRMAQCRRPIEEFTSFRIWLYAVATQNVVPPTHPERFGLTDAMQELRAERPSSQREQLVLAIRDLQVSIRQPFLLLVVAGLSMEETAMCCNFTKGRTVACVEKACRRLQSNAALREVVGAEVNFPSAAHLEFGRRLAERLRDIAPFPFPESVAEVFNERIAEAAQKPVSDLRLARPGPELRTLQKVAISALVVVAVIGLILGVLLKRAPQPLAPLPVGTVVQAAGMVRVVSPDGAPAVEPALHAELRVAQAVRTGGDGLAVIRGPRASWIVDRDSTLQLLGPGKAALLDGRAHVRTAPGLKEPLEVTVPAHGLTVRLRAPLLRPAQPGFGGGAEAVLWSARRSLRACAARGELTVEGERESRQLQSGECAMWLDGRCVGPVRPARAGDINHWTDIRWAEDGMTLSARQLAAAPVTPGSARIPSGTTVERLRLRITLRGALALVQVAAQLSGPAPQETGKGLDAAQLVLPLPLVSTPGEVSHDDDGNVEIATWAVCVLENREERYALGINPGAWTRSAIGRVEVSVDAFAAEGGGELRCPGLEMRGKEGARLESWTGQGVDPGRPIVLELAPAEVSGVDCLPLSDGESEWGVVAWRPGAPKVGWLGEESRVLLAFDATAHFGPGGRYYAHELLAGLLEGLPHRCRVALAVNDGTVKLDKLSFSTLFPNRLVEMEAAVWSVEAGRAPPDVRFLRGAARILAGAGGDGLLLYLTGTQDAPEEMVLAPPPALKGLRAIVLQLGAERPSAGWRSLCGDSGGIVRAIPAAAAPRTAARDVLWSLTRPALTQVRLETQGGAAALVGGPRRFGTRPVVALAQLGGDGLSGRFSARAGDTLLEQKVGISVPAGDALRVPGRLIRLLRNRAKECEMPK